MQDLADMLRQLRRDNPDIDLILANYADIEQVYSRALEAMTLTPPPGGTSASSQVTISVEAAPSIRIVRE